MIYFLQGAIGVCGLVWWLGREHDYGDRADARLSGDLGTNGRNDLRGAELS